MAPFGDVPDISCCDCPVGPCVLGVSHDATEGVEGVGAGVVRRITKHLGSKGALVRPPGVGMGARGTAAFHGHGTGIMDRTL